MKRITVLAALTAAFASACSKPAEEAEHVQPVVTASVATIVPQRFTETVDAIGVVTPRAGHVASLAAPGPTRVASVKVAMGARVHTGDALVELDRLPFETAVRSADAALAAAQSAADRAQRLADAGVLPKKDAEQAVAELAQARANSQTAHRALDLASVRSPIDGIVTKVNTMLGAGVDAGQSLIDVTDESVLDVALTLSMADAQRVKIGQSVVLHAGSDATAAIVATGRVVDVSGAVDSASLGVTARIELPAGTKTVRIGETVFGQVAVAEHARAIVIPLEALVPDGDGFKVFVVGAEGLALSRAVTVGARSDSSAWITDGLKAGERVVTHGAYGVSDSSKVVSDSAKAGGDSAKAEAKAEKEKSE